MFTKIEQDRFARHGLIKRSGFLPTAQLARARAVLFQQFAREGIWKAGQWQLTRQEFIPGLTAGMALVKPLNRHPAIIELAGGATLAAASALAGARPVYPMNPHPALDTAASELAPGLAATCRKRSAGCADLCHPRRCRAGRRRYAGNHRLASAAQ